MSSAYTNTSPVAGADSLPWQYAQAKDHQRQAALAVMLTGDPVHPSPAVQSFLSFASHNHFNLDDCWIASQGSNIKLTLLLLHGQGRTAMAFVSPLKQPGLEPIAAQLAKVAMGQQDASEVQMVQVLLDPAQVREAASLELGGFVKLAELIYMQRAAHNTVQPLELDAALTCVTWSGENEHYFADGILASYQQTLDCPGLVGKRSIGDIMAGHRATGRFTPQLWFAVHRQGRPAGVMLLNFVPSQHALELVYLGIAPAWRGKGLARRLLKHALCLGPSHGADQVILAVDRQNQPALKLYRSLRFSSTARKLAMVCFLS